MRPCATAWIGAPSQAAIQWPFQRSRPPALASPYCASSAPRTGHGSLPFSEVNGLSLGETFGGRSASVFFSDSISWRMLRSSSLSCARLSLSPDSRDLSLTSRSEEHTSELQSLIPIP